MSCGDTAWWRSPDFVGLLQRHGQVEHLVVQFDFLVQVHRNGRAGYSIPGASKSRSGNPGYADIVSIATGEIWEIKPKRLENRAFEEAESYVTNAKANCGPKWRAGTSFTTTNRWGGGGVVYRLEGNGNKAELVAQQGRAGTVLYCWRINGKERPSLVPGFAWALRQQIVADYFTTGQPPQPLPGAKPPDNFPPVKFKPPVLRPDACIPQLGGYIPQLLKQIWATVAPTVIDNSAVAILLPTTVVDALVGVDVAARQASMLRVKGADPTVTLYREAMIVLTGASVAHGVVGVQLGLTGVLYLALGGATLTGAVIVVSCEATAAAAPVVATEGLLGAFAAAVRSAQALHGAVAAGAGLLVFAIPRASSASPGSPVAFDAYLPKFVALKPSDPAASVGQTKTIDGAEWRVVAIARTIPD